jgi:hypothetical protein
VITREPIFQALFALAQTISWGTPATTFAYSARRVKLWSDIPVQPALCQAEHDEDFEQITRMPSKRTLSAAWLIYQNTGANDPNSTPTVLNNTILDAVDDALTPPAWSDTQTLGGLVEHCWIDGKVFKDPGDLDGQGLMVVPIKILIP